MIVQSGNRLEALADAIFERLAGNLVSDPASVLSRRDCIVVPSRILQVWLQQRYLYRGPSGAAPRILTQCDFPLLNVFVNDWLYRMDTPGAGSRDPASHPFSVESMHWRLYRLLEAVEGNSDPEVAPLRRFLGDAGSDSSRRARRRFQLAGRLATLFDGYTVYRPEMLARWEEGRPVDIPDRYLASLKWEPALWRALTEGGLRDRTYLAAFRRMERRLADGGISGVYSAIHVFGPAALPRVYQVFFQVLGDVLPVYLYLFNPSPTDWIARPAPGRAEQARARLRLEAEDETAGLFEQDNPLLAGYGRGIHESLSELLDLLEGDIGTAEKGAEARDSGTLLSAVQAGVASNTRTLPAFDEEERKARTAARRAKLPVSAFRSLQVHCCHSPQREVEALRDTLLAWFTATGIQPREVQVQVSDLALYGPYIDAVFSSPHRDAPDTIPYVIADRIRAGESAAAEGFLRLLDLVDSRFTAPAVLELLQCDSLRGAFGISPDERDTIHGWVAAAGIRWGRDEMHRARETDVAFTAATTWQYGLDRLLKGYALGRKGSAQARTPPLPCDVVEGDSADTLGKLARFIEVLGITAGTFSRPLSVGQWVDALNRAIDDFFTSDNETYGDVALLRQAVEALRKSAEAAEAVEASAEIDVIRCFLRAHLQGAIGGENLAGNAVVFSALRPGSSAPRSVMCLLGMGDGDFPRQDNRPAYDVLRIQRKRCDRTPRMDDRTAFLEALFSARDLFYISYCGFSPEDGAEIPSSVLVRELLDAVGEPYPIVTRHKLQAFHPDYFVGEATLFSYSSENRQASFRLREKAFGTPPPEEEEEEDGAMVEPAPEEPPPAVPSPPIDLADLTALFANPAEYYYRRILGIRLDRRPRALEEAEEFAPEPLSAYTVRAQVVEAMVAHRAGDEDRDRWRQRLEDAGLVPLAAWGRTWFARHWDEVTALLDTPLEGLPGTLRTVLLHQRESGSTTEHSVATNGRVITGRVSAGPGPDTRPLSVQFHPASPKAHRRLTAFLEHLFACAAGMTETRYCVERMAATRLAVTVFDPIPPEPAARQLGTYADLFLAGTASVLPFAPETALAFVNALVHPPKGTRPDDASRRAAARGMAEQAWASSDYRRGEEEDPYLRNVFGPAGPGQTAGFETTATAILCPLMEAAGQGAPNRDIRA